jgi:hypothetical protein
MMGSAIHMALLIILVTGREGCSCWHPGIANIRGTRGLQSGQIYDT